MNLSNVIIFLILLSIFAFALKGTVSHFKGEGACCGGGGKDVKTKPKKLGRIMETKNARISGMHCDHCYAKVSNALNSINGVSAMVKGRKGTAIVKADRILDDAEIILAVTRLGYEVLDITDKTGKNI